MLIFFKLKDSKNTCVAGSMASNTILNVQVVEWADDIVCIYLGLRLQSIFEQCWVIVTVIYL